MSTLFNWLGSFWNYIVSYYLYYPLYSLLGAYVLLFMLAVITAHTLTSVYGSRWSIPKCVHRSFAFFFLVHLILMLFFGVDALISAWVALPYRFGMVTPYLRVLPYLLLMVVDIWAVATLFNLDKGMAGKAVRAEAI